MKLLLVSVLLSFALADGYKILIFVPGLSDSQAVFNYRLGELLSEKGGHEVTMYRPQYSPDVTKGKPTGRMKEIRTTAILDGETYRELQRSFAGEAFKSEMSMNFTVFNIFSRMNAEGCETQVTNKQLLKQLEEEKFDLAIAHMYDFCPLGMIHLLKIPTYIWMSSAQLLEFIASYSGAPTFPSYTPNSMSHKSDRMTFYERFENFAAFLVTMPLVEHFMLTPQTAMFRKHFGESFPLLSDFARNAPLVFVNSEEFLDFPRPILHKIVYTGGIGMQEAAPLDKEWTEIVGSPIAKRGVVLFSLGTVVNSKDMPAEMRKSLIDAFKRFPDILFIVKFDCDFPEAAGVTNVIVRKWVPQKDLLAHPKTKAFITHGGYNSLLESAYCGTPVIAIPLFGDQMTNVRRAQRHGICIGLNKLQITDATVSAALKEIMDNKTYYENSQRLSRMLKKKPVKGEELALRWVDFLAEFKQLPNLQPVSAWMGTVEYLSIDVIGMVALVALVALLIFCKIVAFVCRRCCRKHPRSGQKAKLN